MSRVHRSLSIPDLGRILLIISLHYFKIALQSGPLLKVRGRVHPQVSFQQYSQRVHACLFAGICTADFVVGSRRVLFRQARTVVY